MVPFQARRSPCVFRSRAPRQTRRPSRIRFPQVPPRLPASLPRRGGLHRPLVRCSLPQRIRLLNVRGHPVALPHRQPSAHSPLPCVPARDKFDRWDRYAADENLNLHLVLGRLAGHGPYTRHERPPVSEAPRDDALRDSLPDVAQTAGGDGPTRAGCHRQ